MKNKEEFTVEDWKAFRATHQRLKKEHRVESIIQAIEQYQQVYGTTKPIPRRYSIPINNPHFHETFWEMHLGDIVQSIRTKGMHAKYRTKWMELGILPSTAKFEESCK